MITIYKIANRVCLFCNNKTFESRIIRLLFTHLMNLIHFTPIFCSKITRFVKQFFMPKCFLRKAYLVLHLII